MRILDHLLLVTVDRPLRKSPPYTSSGLEIDMIKVNCYFTTFQIFNEKTSNLLPLLQNPVILKLQPIDVILVNALPFNEVASKYN